MALEVAPLVTFVSGTVGAVGVVGAASLGLRAVLQTFKILRDQMGMGVKESMIEAKRVVALQKHMAAREAMTSDQRQAEKRSHALTAQDVEDLAWQRHEELKASGFKNEMPPSTGYKFF